MIVGDRDCQEDCLAYSVSDDGKTQFVIVADGMGGHAAGEVASSIVVKTMLDRVENELFDKPELGEFQIQAVLRSAAERANRRLAQYQVKKPDAKGMGTTMTAVLIHEHRINWISIGDSPFFMVEGDELRRLNADHSVAGLLARMVEAGKLAPEEAANDPRRSQLTSAMTGQAVPEIDQNVLALTEGVTATFILASDGILSVSAERMTDTVKAANGQESAQLAKTLVEHVLSAGVPNQDNTSVAVIRAVAPQ